MHTTLEYGNRYLYLFSPHFMYNHIIMTNQDESYFYNRILELANRAYQNNMYVFSDFMGINEQDIFFSALKDKNMPPISYSLFGGNENCERKMACFGSENDFGYQMDFPISCILIEPISPKNAQLYSHRDFLGALMSLGLERKKFGDIFVDKLNAYIYCSTQTAEYIMDNLASVGRNTVKCSYSALPDAYIKETLITQIIQCTSPRIDAIVAKIYNFSRKDVISLFQDRKVYVNGRLVTNNDKALQPGDSVTVRGFGKFTYASNKGISKKGKMNIEIERFGK